MAGRSLRVNGKAIKKRRATLRLTAAEKELLQRQVDVGLTQEELATLICWPDLDKHESWTRNVRRLRPRLAEVGRK